MEAPERAYGIAPPDFALPDATHVGGVRLQISDLARSLTYYEQSVAPGDGGLLSHSCRRRAGSPNSGIGSWVSPRVQLDSRLVEPAV